MQWISAALLWQQPSNCILCASFWEKEDILWDPRSKMVADELAKHPLQIMMIKNFFGYSDF